MPEWFVRAVSALDAKMGLEVLELTAERVVGRMPVAGNTQPMGLWHGGASCVLAETLASIGSMAHAPPDRLAFGVDINATHHRSADSGWVTGTATALRLGRTVAMYEIVLTDDAGTPDLHGPRHLPGHRTSIDARRRTFGSPAEAGASQRDPRRGGARLDLVGSAAFVARPGSAGSCSSADGRTLLVRCRHRTVT